MLGEIILHHAQHSKRAMSVSSGVVAGDALLWMAELREANREGQREEDGADRAGDSVSTHTSAILSFIIPRLLVLQGLNPSNAQLLGSHAAPLVP
jgi:hypothetical protein